MGLILKGDFWRGRRVLVTGHTGFKGAWLALWLHELGADVFGFALPPENEHCLFARCRLEELIHSHIGDVRSLTEVSGTFAAAAPEVVFHLAAQPLVRRSYRAPVETFETNVMGTVNLLEAVRRAGSVRSVIMVTSDKCYENRDGDGGVPPAFVEDDPLGGSDPYSASKACAELVARVYREAWMSGDGGAPAVATVRAGNVIGGGDYAEDRIVPDAIRALSRNDALVVRNPMAVRPWQHVLEPLAGYLALAERLHTEGAGWACAWNFGPREEDAVPVATLVDLVMEAWGGGSWRADPASDGLHERPQLRLNSDKARRQLGWQPKLSLSESVSMAVRWYREALDAEGTPLRRYSVDQLHHYEGLVPAI